MGHGAPAVGKPVSEHGADLVGRQGVAVGVVDGRVVLVLGVIESGADAVGQIVIETPAVELVGVVVDVLGDVVDVVRRVIAVGRNRVVPGIEAKIRVAAVKFAVAGLPEQVIQAGAVEPLALVREPVRELVHGQEF